MVGVALLGVAGEAGAVIRATVDAGRGPVAVLLPDRIGTSAELPLIVVLHGFGSTGEGYLRSWPERLVNERNVILAAPTGTIDSRGRRFWDATDACCSKDGVVVDDSAYLWDVVESVATMAPVDLDAVHMVGFSNGGFMALRMACDHAERLASVVSVAGAGFADPSRCSPAAPVSVLQVHGRDDDRILYGGGLSRPYGDRPRVRYPGAAETMAFWAKHNEAEPHPESLRGHDFSQISAGPDTEIARYLGGAADAELWSIEGEGHAPRFTEAYRRALLDWMLRQRRTVCQPMSVRP